MALNPMGNIPTGATLGAFDEDSCRFFLGQIGRSVVPYYPFETGLEEIYCLILEKYGYAGIPDALSLLQQLLEDDGSMSGFGDDDDIWRCWHYRWKHRNDNAVEPFVPRIGHFVLPSPTPYLIRKVKATNFLRANCDSTISSNNNVPELSPYELTMPNGPTFSHQRYRLKLPDDAREDQNTQEAESRSSRSRSESLSSNDQDSQQEFEEVTSAPDPNSDPSLLITFEMMEPPYPSNGRDLNLRGGKLCTLRQVSSSPKAKGRLKPETEAPKLPNRALQIGKSGSPWSEEEERSKSPTQMPEQVLEVQPSKTRQIAFSETKKPPMGSKAEVRETGVSQNDHISPIESDVWQGNALQTVQERREPKAGQVTNRHARLIDGAIFTMGSRKRKEDMHDISKESEVEAREDKRSLVRRSWTISRQKDEIRGSWLQRARSLLRSERTGKQRDSVSSIQLSASEGNSSPQIEIHPKHHRNPSEVSQPKSVRPNRNLRLFLDGGGDDHFASTTSALDLNKSLPLSPVDIVHSILSNGQNPQMDKSQEKVHQLRAKPYPDPAFRPGMTKTEFRELACELMGSSISEHPQTSANFIGAAALDPRKSASPTCNSPSRSPMTFSSISNRNPFTDDPVPLTPSITRRMRARTAEAEAEAGEGPTPQTTNIHRQLFTPSENESAMRDHQIYHNGHSEARLSPEQFRGRRKEMPAVSRPRQISSSADRVEKTRLLQLPEKNARRSRSPVKRLLGLGKSSSMKELSSNLPEEKEQNTAESTTKRSLRNWGNKLRHGFLTADHEQLENEDNMEQYIKDTIQVFLEPALPVSLAPAYQARIQSNIELMISATANRFLLHEFREGQVSEDSLLKVQRSWDSRGLPNVTECRYDQSTQRALVMMNLSSVHFKGQCAENPMSLNATMHSWATLAKEMSVRMFCWPDGVVRKHLHDAQQIVEMLGAPASIIMSLQSLQVKVLTKINQIQKEKTEMQSRSFSHRRNVSESSKNSVIHKRTISDGSWPEGWTGVEDNFEALNFDTNLSPQIKMRKATGAEGALAQGRSPRTR